MSGQALQVIKPLTITDAMLDSTDVTEADYAAWSGATTYALADRVISTTTHKIYESLQGGNLNKDPTNAANATWWAEVSPTNRWKLFDAANSTQTAKSTSMYYVLTPAIACTGLAALNISNGTSIRVRVTDPTDGLVYDETTDLVDPPPEASWWSYFFDPIEFRTSHVALDLPSYPSADIRVDFAGGTSLAVGVLLLGQQVQIGNAVHAGARIGITDYSRKETNTFGDVVLVQRAFAKRASIKTWIPRAQLATTYNVLASLRATPALWVGNTGIEPLQVFGWWRDFDVVIAYADYSECNIEIEGLT